MRRVWTIAQGELKYMVRHRIASIGMFIFVVLSIVAAISSWSTTSHLRILREAGQHAANHDFDSQPARHPHRMVHYGHYVYRPVSTLATFDPGVDPFTGTVIFLEGHRQNSATFGAVREASGLMRFGLLTPAFVLQTLVPLLLIFLGFACVCRERQMLSIQLLRTHSASNVDIVLGKLLALVLAVVVILLPAFIALALSVVVQPSTLFAAMFIALGYILYLLIWCISIVSISSLVTHSRVSLMALVAMWVVITILLPRLAADIASQSVVLPSRIETDLTIHRELRSIGDSHNPDDPYFSAFRKKILAKYNVERIEDLPVNYRGILSAKGEELTSELFDKYAALNAEIQRQQLEVLQTFSMFSIAMAVRRISMLAAGTDLNSHLLFLKQSEAYRFDMIQRLNKMHAEKLSFADDKRRSIDPDAEKRTRISADNWKSIPDFKFDAPSFEHQTSAMLVALSWLIIWLLVSIGCLTGSIHRLGRV